VQRPDPTGTLSKAGFANASQVNAGSPEKALLEHLVHLHGKPEEPQDEEPLG
jgi:hypothetical protein